MTVTVQKASKRHGGRRAMLPEERRAYSVKTGFNENEIGLLERRAEAVGLSCSELIRRLAIGQPIYAIPAINREAVIELGRIGNNINQATRHMNARLDDLEHNKLRSDLVSLRQQLNAVTKLLLQGPADGDH